MRSVYDAIKAVFSIRPQSATSNVNGSAVDTSGYNSAAVVLEVGAVSGTNPTLNVKIQESADGSTGWTDVAGAVFTQVTAANNSQIIRVEGLGTSRQRYLRAVATLGGTSPNFTFAVEFLLGRAYKEPVN
jgi:hypothetical protein